ncbi:hypothetical protein [Rhizobium leguminosarum]|uniref:hypothetical protein n=1 Tax=Rhizobium leguminosarum TaxID=384 RepID=UPI000366F79F|nr:hypothetical protein [Rhizobium leguminosarum]
MEKFELPCEYSLHRTEKTIAICDATGRPVQSRFDVKCFVRDMREARPLEENIAAEVKRLRAAVQSALDDLCTAELSTDLIPIELRAIQTLRAALAQQKQEG